MNINHSIWYCRHESIFLLHWEFTLVYKANEKNETGGACRKYGGKERCIQDFGGETWGNATTWETQA
jgi:hypothetical protein